MIDRRSALVLAALVTAAACAPTAPVPPVPAEGDCVVIDDTARPRVVLGVAEAPGRFDEQMTGAQVYETLVRVDCMGRVTAGLAIGWSGSGREWRFDIRRSTSFSDGTPVDARSIATALSSLPYFAGVAAVGEYDLRVMLTEPADIRLFAHRDLSVRMATHTGTVVGTGAYARVNDPRERALVLALRSSPVGKRADAPMPDTIAARAFGTDPRTAIDAGVDLLVTHEAAAIAYARARSGYFIRPLTWRSTYVLAAARTGNGTAPPADAFPSAVVGAAARPAQPPFWWEDCGPVMDAGASSLPAPTGTVAAQASRILFLRDDPVARAIAERIAALARGRAPPWLASRLAAHAAPVAVGVGHTELHAALEDGAALAVVTRIRRVAHGGCSPDSFLEQARLLHNWSVTPLIDVRDDLIHRAGIGRVTVDADGTLRFGGR